MNKFRIKLLIWLLPLLLASCMSDRFSCPYARGGKCMMLSDIDAMVKSGEIEKFHQSKRCPGRKCNKDNDQKPLLANHRDLKAKLSKNEEQGQYLEGDNLYVK